MKNRVILAALIAVLTVQPAEAISARKVITAPFKYGWKATKATAAFVVRVNDNPKVQATVRVISTVTTVAGAGFFLKGLATKL